LLLLFSQFFRHFSSPVPCLWLLFDTASFETFARTGACYKSLGTSSPSQSAICGIGGNSILLTQNASGNPGYTKFVTRTLGRASIVQSTCVEIFPRAILGMKCSSRGLQEGRPAGGEIFRSCHRECRVKLWLVHRWDGNAAPGGLSIPSGQ